jgi:hypothetical protein
MSRRHFMVDAQQALGFLTEQTSYIETEVYQMQYPDIQYPNLVPVDTSANEWAKSVTFFSMDKVGAADWFHHAATDMRLADVFRSKFEQGIEMAGIGYRYTLEEIGQALMIPGTNLTNERADAARRAYEEFVEGIAFVGDANKNWTGLVNNATVTRVDAANDGVGTTRTWSTKTADQIIRDINDALTGVYTGSNTVEMADTVLLPPTSLSLASTRRIDGTTMTVLQYILQYNVYTLQTGQPLVIRSVRQLETAGNSGVKRMVVYRRDPRVVKMHIPMPHRFMPVWQRGPITFDIPGIFRLGGVEIRRPGAVRYVDGI